MADQINLLSTPENYATPDQLASMNAYSKALLENSMKPIQHWTQGLQHVVEALVGGNQSWLANQKKNESDAVRAGRMMPDTSGKPPADPFQSSLSPAGNKTTGEPKAAEATASQSRGYRNNNPLNIESGNFTQGQPGYSGSDGRFAKFDSMDSGVKAANTLLDSYGKRGFDTVAKIIGRWAPAGDGNNVDAYVANVSKQLGIDPNMPVPPEMREKLVAAMAQHENGRPMPSMSLAGPDAAQPSAAQAMAKALNPKMAEAQTAAAGAKVPPVNLSAKPDPENQGIFINPALVPKRPQLNEGQVRGVLADPTVSEQTKLLLRQEYINRDAPIEVPVPGGVVRINPLNPTIQQFIPELKWEKSKLGDMESTTGMTYDPRKGGVVVAPKIFPGAAGPRSDAGPAVAPGAPVAPAAVPQAPSPAPAVPGTAVAGAASAAPLGASAPPVAAPAQAPTQVASIDPAAGAAAAAAGAPVESAAMNDTPLGKWAQARPPGVEPGNAAATPAAGLNLNQFSPQETADYEAKKAFDIKKNVDEEAQKKGVELAMKKYDNMSQQAQAARKLRPNLDMAITMLDDQNFSSGLLHGVKDTWQRFKEATGIEKMANAPNEGFDKLMAGTVLDTMKSTLQGLGQVRLAEIDLLNRANGNRNNGIASNRAVLEISRRGVEKIDQLDSMAQAYMSGDEVVNPITGKPVLKANVNRNGEIEPRRGLDAGFDKIARQFTNEHPSFTPAEIKNYHALFEGKLDPNTGQPKAETPKVGDTKNFDDGKGGTVKGVWDGQKWGPAK